MAADQCADCRLFVPGHALHEKDLQRQKGVGTLVSCQEQRAAVVLRISRGFCSSIGSHKISFVRASEETFGTVVLDALGGRMVGCLLGERIRRRPELPGPAPPGHTAVRRPPRPSRGMSGFWIRQASVNHVHARHVRQFGKSSAMQRGQNGPILLWPVILEWNCDVRKACADMSLLPLPHPLLRCSLPPGSPTDRTTALCSRMSALVSSMTPSSSASMLLEGAMG